MRNRDNVGGRLGDVSGRLGDVSGRLGDVSGRETFAEVESLLLQARRSGTLECLELKVDQMQSELLAIARWLDLRIQFLQQDVEGAVNDVAVQAVRVEDHEGRLNNLEASLPRTPPPTP